MPNDTPSSPALILSGRDVTAVLGPTNTGKTHLAIERMVAHESGVIGLPLRLLAREVYGRVCDKVGADKVALVTGEEKIQPKGARYSVCTVEALPRETDAAFVAIDEVQLAADLERGHIFTDRILHLRGRQETLLLGALTMRPILEKLLRGLNVVTRPRMSMLAWSGQKKVTRLPSRSAIVAFSADEVYAIGMGLNLDVDHVAFAQNRKFDGYQYRDLSPAELGQIAGRAGRHMRDGTFGSTGMVDAFDDDLVKKIESHDFDPVRVLQWRTARFDFSSLDALRRSIETTAPVEGLTRALPAVDQRALETLARDEDIAHLADRPERVALLWEACALPDYRRIAPAQHAELIGAIFADLARRGHVDEEYMAEQVRRADSAEGDIDSLSQRVAQIRTWTFVSHRPGWLRHPAHWQERTRAIEDRLSDALHERLTKRFVDRRTSVLQKRLRENAMLEAEISPSGAVLVEGHHVGELLGFRFTPDASAAGEDAKAVRGAAQKALAGEFEARAERFSSCPNGDLAIGADGYLRWLGQTVAALAAGDDALAPRVILLADEQLTGPARDKVQARADRFVAFQAQTLIKPLFDLRAAELTGIARGVAYRIAEAFGVLERRAVADEIKSLDHESRAALRRLGVRIGAWHLFVPALLKPKPAEFSTLLWALAHDGRDKPGYQDVVTALASGRTSLAVNADFAPEFYALAGYRRLGARAVRVDILERLADLIRPALAWRKGAGPRPEGAFDGHAFLATPAMMSILGATGDDMTETLKALGYRAKPRKADDVAAALAATDAAWKAAEADKIAAKAAAAQSAEAGSEATPAAEDDPAAATSGAEPTSEADSAFAGPDAVTEAPVTAVAEAPSGDVDPEAAVDEPEAREIAVEIAAAAVDQPVQAGSAGEPPPPVIAPAEEPKMVLLWRQQRFERHRGPRRDGRKSDDRQKSEARPEGEARHRGPRRDERPQGDAAGRRPDGKPWPQGKPGRRDDRRNDRPEREDRTAKPAFQPRREESRPVRLDPDSPFAKLAALREQMKNK